MTEIEQLKEATSKLIDAITYDVTGTHGKGGNGGLVSNETIRASDQCRLVLNQIDSDIMHEADERRRNEVTE